MHSNYHTQHAPFGAFASFTIGLHNASGGFGQALGGPANQNIYVGWRRQGQEQWQLLPFFKATHSKLADFTGEAVASKKSEPYRQLEAGEFERVLGWATDTWTAGPFHFSIASPFDHVPPVETLDPAQARFFTAPALAATLGFDNSQGDSGIELIFGLGDPAQPASPLSDSGPGLLGFSSGRRYGYAALPQDHLRALQGLSVLRQEFADFDGCHRLGHESGLVLTVPPGAKATLPLALGFYDAGIVTTGLDCSYFYTQHFTSLLDVLRHGLQQHSAYTELASRRDAELAGSGLSVEQKWLLAQATHSYYGSSELLLHEEKPLWNVNEGEYRMMNTFDLTVDHLFFELEWHPWAMRNALDLYVEQYSYHDDIKSLEGGSAAGGLSFAHDMGISNQFSPRGRSSYECLDIHGCFSHMTMEQLVNWVCCAVTYGLKTGDLEWLRGKQATLLECKESILRRDDPDPSKRNGLMKWDSQRCGVGTEITTYDSLDISLGQARNNLYLGVKTLAAWFLLERAFGLLGLATEAADASHCADLLAKTLEDHFEPDTGFFPAVLEKGNRSRILPAVEGLVFPLYLGMTELLDRKGRFAPLLTRLDQHMRGALRRGVCLDEKTGGWKISSTSHNSWFSKIALAQHVTRSIFPGAITPEAAAADASHVAWEQGPGCAPWAMCDQVHSSTGVALGSKYYPRGVTAYLWMSEKNSSK